MGQSWVKPSTERYVQTIVLVRGQASRTRITEETRAIKSWDPDCRIVPCETWMEATAMLARELSKGLKRAVVHVAAQPESRPWLSKPPQSWPNRPQSSWVVRDGNTECELGTFLKELVKQAGSSGAVVDVAADEASPTAVVVLARLPNGVGTLYAGDFYQGHRQQLLLRYDSSMRFGAGPLRPAPAAAEESKSNPNSDPLVVGLAPIEEATSIAEEEEISDILLTELTPHRLKSIGAAKVARLKQEGITSVERLAQIDITDVALCIRLTRRKLGYRSRYAVTTVRRWRDIARAYLATHPIQ